MSQYKEATLTGSALTPKNRRKCPRYGLDKRLKIRLQVDGKEQVLHGRTRDVSEGGVGAVVSGMLNLGDRVVLEFQDVDGAALELPAVVLHRKGFYFGIEFSSLTDAQRLAIRKTCAREGKPGF